MNDTSRWIKAAQQYRFNRVENEDSYDFCTMYHNAPERYSSQEAHYAGAQFDRCSSWEHRPTYFSLIHQYELFCSREALVALTQSFHLLGVLLGGIIAFYMLKVISPRRTMLVGMVTQIFLGLATGYAPTYELHLIFRCSVAATCSLMCIGIMIGRCWARRESSSHALIFPLKQFQTSRQESTESPRFASSNSSGRLA